ncbi:hypothetical protein CVD25_01785 [Bacillus canaveralius]|uniref:Uncharacterized protein n=1 Tax=Bacillus canaveralius TaxID=1403243 RepID=A0A2N5GJA9_9BACI|nr:MULTISPECIES: hypothetical protein [Bacillus]PLR81198.1 hypothetical protein CU635_15675 [Bacillus canaveralius]PLR86635.1 hypothetical protein CVD23_05715 [Bacillus sp. V33-4]PLS00645.1 hypothetical protein CVD25_01785 [Bacillus canaveralius]RSK51539.1 hypothetical protein EJA13_14175 [Bacillus canaveralius]
MALILIGIVLIIIIIGLTGGSSFRGKARGNYHSGIHSNTSVGGFFTGDCSDGASGGDSGCGD